MRRSRLILAVLTAVVLGPTVTAKQILAPVTTILVGELVDSACYMAAQNAKVVNGVDHAKCAIACAQKGQRLALVTLAGDVYMVTGALTDNNNAKLIQLIGRQVMLTGTATEGRVLESLAPAAAAPLDLRRTPSQDGVVTVHVVRQGDSREGDLKQGIVRTIEPISVEPVVSVQIPVQ